MAAKKTAAVKAQAAKTTEKKASAKKTLSYEDISKRAFEIYVSNGGSASAEQNWIQAEKELSK